MQLNVKETSAKYWLKRHNVIIYPLTDKYARRKFVLLSDFNTAGNGWSLIVKVDGLTPDNFKPSYFHICNELTIEDYIDLNAVKPTQYNVLSYDPNIYVNDEPFIFKSVGDIIAPHPKHRERAYTGLGGAGNKIR